MGIKLDNLVCCSSMSADIAFSVKGIDAASWGRDSIRLPEAELRIGKFFTLRVKSVADGWVVVKARLQNLTLSVSSSLLRVCRKSVNRAVCQAGRIFLAEKARFTRMRREVFELIQTLRL